MRAMILKEFRELRRDRRTMAMIIVFPILMLIMFGYAANFDVDSIPTAYLGPQAEQASQTASQQGNDLFATVIVDPTGDAAKAEELLRDADAQVAIVTGTQPPTAYVDGSSLFAAQAATAVLGRLGDGISIEVLFNPDLKSSWVLIPGLIGYILMFIGTVVTSIGLVRERENGTLEQLAVMPLTPTSVILGKVIPYFILAAVDMVIVTVLAIILFGLPFSGSIFLFGVAAAIYLLVVLGVGVLISTVSQTTGQAIQLAIFFLVPQILLSGMIFPLTSIPWAIRWISYLLPLTYYSIIAPGIMLRDAGLNSLWPSYLVLTVMAVFVFTGAVVRFRKDLSPRRRHETGDAVPGEAAA